ncbi:tryptophan-rich sensory protein [Polaribacter litorisediminis]|uniref:tryptophan-rich sensory protein n=1 Tax=Polaribacter litorisediminis TaxID=1908341 RepID=UPI001CBDC8E4|nr:tryptophan-rich sensory protein [Polaribacter litorisediminis]UAM97136.1 tryptophan-rich sensory protein [Polaribacter litorisediminis]
MITSAKKILTRFTKKWQLLLLLEVCLYAFGISAMVYLLSQNFILTISVFIISFLISLLIIKPWKINIQTTTQFVDAELEDLENSTSLFLKAAEDLTSLAKLQRSKIEQKLQQEIKKIKFPVKIKRAISYAFLFVIMGFVGFFFNIKSYFSTSFVTESPIKTISFKAIDAVGNAYQPPKIIEQNLRIRFPNYTNLSTKNTDNMNVKAVEGSRITWSLKFSNNIKKVSIESTSNSYEMLLQDGAYKGSILLKNSGFYNFHFLDTLNQKYTSSLYAIEVLKDEAPKIEINGLEAYKSFNFNDEKLLDFISIISDDFGLEKAHIIATVSKGSGESVKFREEKMLFNSVIAQGEKSVALPKQINLDNLKMEPGDELYFYVEASDLKRPQFNIARSETYFATIKDTVTDNFSVEATLGVNRMPDYFRSQRQLIIDTKKLIANKKKLTDSEFKFKSNELGFDQKVLRTKYSTFMGDENENTDLVTEENLEDFESEHAEHGDEEDDPLAAYSHKHDTENEHNLVDEKSKNDSKNPLQEFTHNHADAEAATLFEASLKSKLLKALQHMWDSELQLRVYKPEKSLPYQYKALKSLQEIKNSARIYVHRIGFDPPPIKENKRLTGTLKDVKSFSKQEEIPIDDQFKFMRQASSRLELMIQNKVKTTKTDQFLFEKAGNELALIAIEKPGEHLKTLQQLKELTTFGEKSIVFLKSTQKGLINAIPNLKPNPSQSNRFKDELTEILLKELQINDQ